MPKIHLKNLATDHLSLCDIWPGNNWVLKALAEQQATDRVCKICGTVAAKIPLNRNRINPHLVVPGDLKRTG
jgi:hypothetical protein